MSPRHRRELHRQIEQERKRREVRSLFERLDRELSYYNSDDEIDAYILTFSVEAEAGVFAGGKWEPYGQSFVKFLNGPHKGEIHVYRVGSISGSVGTTIEAGVSGNVTAGIGSYYGPDSEITPESFAGGAKEIGFEASIPGGEFGVGIGYDGDAATTGTSGKKDGYPLPLVSEGYKGWRTITVGGGLAAAAGFEFGVSEGVSKSELETQTIDLQYLPRQPIIQDGYN